MTYEAVEFIVSWTGPPAELHNACLAGRTNRAFGHDLPIVLIHAPASQAGG